MNDKYCNFIDAINELVGRIDDQYTIIGDIESLTTTNKISIVSAVNEVNGKVLKGTYTIPKPDSLNLQEITITTGKDMTDAFIVIDCMEKEISDVPQFLIGSRTTTGFTFSFLPGGTSRPYPCTWIAVF